MKLFFLFMFFSVQAMASLVGNLADPAILEEGFWIPDHCWSSLRAGMTGDFLFCKRLKPCRVSRSMHLERPEIDWQLAICDIGWNIRERFDLHFLAGPAASSALHWRQNHTAYAAHSHRGLFWGAGSKLIVLEVEDTTLGVDFHGGGIEWMEGALTQNGHLTSSDFSSRLYFWQLATGLSQNIGVFRPYIGGAVNQLTCLFYLSGHRVRLHDLIKPGMFEGCSLRLGSRVYLNFEARQFFESGLAVTGEFRF